MVPEKHTRDEVGEGIKLAIEAIKPLLSTDGEVKELSEFDVKMIAERAVRAAMPSMWRDLQTEMKELKEYRRKLYEEKRQQGSL